MNATEAYNPGTTVDRYTIERVLGQGGMATVYRVRHNALGTQHALKVLSLPSKTIQRRLLQEGQVQAKLRHPNIVSVTDVVDVEGAPGLVMEYVDGPTLDALLTETRLTLEQADALVEGIVSGVAFAHDKGLIHRDLKPGTSSSRSTPVESRRKLLISAWRRLLPATISPAVETTPEPARRWARPHTWLPSRSGMRKA